MCVCVWGGLWVFTHSYSFLLDPSYWEYFSSQGNFTSHGHILSYWLTGCQGQKCGDDGATSAGSVFGSGSLEASGSRQESEWTSTTSALHWELITVVIVIRTEMTERWRCCELLQERVSGDES